MSTKKINRRQFLHFSAMTALSVAAAACARQAPAATEAPTQVPAAATEAPAQAPAATEAPTTAAAAEATTAPTAKPVPLYKEAPMLTDLVNAGKLPPVDSRLPKPPKLTNEMPASQLKFENGQYGGTLRTVTSVPDWDADVFVMCNEPLINTPGILGEEITGNIVKEFRVSDDQKEFTFFMRQGLRWSDGEPVTTEDVRFAVEDVLFNEELTPTFPSWLKAGNDPRGNPFKFELIDEFTFKMTFDQAYGGFPIVLAIQGWRGYTDLLKPAHYLKQFHKKYTDEAKLKPLWEAESLEDWVQLFGRKDITNWELNRKEGIGFPALYPWLLKEATQQTYTYERNPYYFKVDEAGQQLPYIDKIVSQTVPDMEMVAMKHISGEVDFARESATLVKMPLYKENEQKAGIKAVLARCHVTYTDVFLNMTFNDPVWREVTQNVKFRQALNYAIDRKEIIDAVYYGYAEPSTIISSEFNTEKAIALLEEIGLDKKDSEGFRIGPDGKTFVIPFEIQAASPDQVPVCELIVQFWNNIGIKTTMKTIDGTLWGQRNGANELQATTIWTHTPLWYMGDWGQGIWGPLWSSWFSTSGKQGEEPPQDVKDFLNLVASINRVSPEQGRQIYQDCRKIMYDKIWYFVHTEKEMQPLLFNAKLGNVSESKDAFAIASNFSAEQFFFKS